MPQWKCRFCDHWIVGDEKPPLAERLCPHCGETGSPPLRQHRPAFASRAPGRRTAPKHGRRAQTQRMPNPTRTPKARGNGRRKKVAKKRTAKP